MQWNLIMLRKLNGYNQKDIADILEISLSTYMRKEAGLSQFKADEMFILKNLFNRRIDEIFLPSNCSEDVIEEDIR